MRRSSALLLALLGTAGCAAQHRPAGELAAAPAPRTIVAIEVTNPYNRTIDVFYGSEFMGTLPPSAHARYPVPPSTERTPIYGRWSGQARDVEFNISSTQTVRYVYEDPAPGDR